MPQVRLQKILAAAGHGSRRACEQLIAQGLVRVNGGVVQGLPCLVDPEHDRVEIDGRPVQRERPVYLMLHKPRGVICTVKDDLGRRSVLDLLSVVRERVYPVGRLDADTSGLLLVTNDGELAQRLTHPRYEVSKTYVAQVEGLVSDEDVARMKKGVYASVGRMQAEHVRVLSRNRTRSVLEVVLTEGRNREVRRMLLTLDHKVRSLQRVKVGELELRGVGPGNFRPLSPGELRYLRQAAGLEKAPGPRGPMLVDGAFVSPPAAGRGRAGGRPGKPGAMGRAKATGNPRATGKPGRAGTPGGGLGGGTSGAAQTGGRGGVSDASSSGSARSRPASGPRPGGKASKLRRADRSTGPDDTGQTGQTGQAGRGSRARSGGGSPHGPSSPSRPRPGSAGGGRPVRRKRS